MLVAALVACGIFSAAAQGSAGDLTRPKPAWLTPSLQDRLHKAGAEGVRVGDETLNTECPGVHTGGVQAAGCIVAPYGCTANFVFTDGVSYYVGTARHCVNKVGDEVTMQVDSATLAVVGTAAKITPGDGEPGQDFALIRIDPAVASKWGVDPAIPVVGGPDGVYEGCDPQPVKYYGHGYGVAVGQGKPEGGLATNWLQSGYGWTGVGAPGDSGSPVVLAANDQAAGNFTHLIVDLQNYPGSDHAGMRITAILQFAGVQLVNADGSRSATNGTQCTSQGAGLLGNLTGGG